jgi:hypothetical protein
MGKCYYPVDQELLRFISAIRNSHPDMVRLYSEGQCYNFALIIRSIRPEAEIRYAYVEGHVYTEVGGRLYDIRGVKPNPAHKYTHIPYLEHRRGHKPHRWGRGDTRRLSK